VWWWGGGGEGGAWLGRGWGGGGGAFGRPNNFRVGARVDSRSAHLENLLHADGCL